MSNKIVQLENEAGDNIYPLAGGALTGSISKTMLEEGVFEGPELSEPSSVAYVATDNIQDGAVTSDKIDWTTSETVYTTASKESYVTIQTVDVHIKVDSAGKVATIWGRTETTSTTATESSLNIQTTLRPSSNIDIVPCGFVTGVDGNGRMNGNMGAAPLRLNTSGVLSIRNINWNDSTSSNRCRTWMFPTTITL